MISKAQSVLLEAIKASLFDVEPKYPSDANWDEVKFEAKAQTVLGLISHKIPVHDASGDQCKANYMRNMHEQNKLIKMFDAAKLPCVILKGSAAAIYYPKPYLRTMGDIDILVQRDRFVEAIDILESDGYIYERRGNEEQFSDETRELEYFKNGICVEIHKRFNSLGVDIDDYLETAMERREYCEINGFRFPVLPVFENGLVLIGHINKHLKSNVLGLRQIIDWEMYVHSVAGNASWYKQFIPLVKKAGFLTLAAYITRLCNKYLGLPDEVDFGVETDDSLVDELIEIVLTDGNFGRRVNADKSNEEKRIMSASYGIKRDGLFAYLTQVGLDKSPFCNKHSNLKILAFFYGFFRQLFVGIRVIFKNMSLVKKLGVGNKMYSMHSNRQELFKKLGVRTGKE